MRLDGIRVGRLPGRRMDGGCKADLCPGNLSMTRRILGPMKPATNLVSGVVPVCWCLQTRRA